MLETSPLPNQPLIPPPQPPVVPSTSKLPLILIGLILVLASGTGGLFIGKYLFISKTLPVPSPTPVSIATLTPDPTANWKTYKDQKNSIEFKYPQSWHYRQAPDWTFDVYLEDRPFEIPEATEFISSIQIHFNEVQNTVTNQKYFMEKTISEAKTRITDLFDPQNVKVIENLTTDGKQTIQVSGIIGPGPLQGDYFKYTIIQLDNKLLFVVLHDKKYEEIYNQILSTFKFTDQNNGICDIDQEYQNTAVNPVTCQCPDGYEWKILSTSFGPCPVGQARDCPQTVQKCSLQN